MNIKIWFAENKPMIAITILYTIVFFIFACIFPIGAVFLLFLIIIVIHYQLEKEGKTTPENKKKLLNPHIEFKLIDKRRKTNVYGIYNIDSGFQLGTIRWTRYLKQYCLFPSNGLVICKSCMEEIIDFINEIPENRKKNN